MKVLILSVDPWQHNNSFGNTYSNIFGQINNIEIAHVYLLDGLPDKEQNVSCYYQIPESELMRSVFKFPRNRHRVGREVQPCCNLEMENYSVNKEIDKTTSCYEFLLGLGKKYHWGGMRVAREIAWKLGNINYEGLYDFIDQFKPDIFLLAYYNVYNSNRIAKHIICKYDIPMVMVMMMDHYSLKRVSWNPLFWIDRLAKRARIRDLVEKSEMMFVISKKLRDEIENELHIKCKVLYKIPDENRSSSPYVVNNGQIRFLFTGNIHANRWKSLALLASALQRQGGGRLDIYTLSPITKEIDKALNIRDVSEIHNPVSQQEVILLQNQADVLVHAEAFDKYNKSLVRCAVSTKIMDYLSMGRCILAIGPKDIASIEYLTDNDLALVASSNEQVEHVVKRIIDNRPVLLEYATKGREYATKVLDAKKMRKALFDDMQGVLDSYHKKLFG